MVIMKSPESLQTQENELTKDEWDQKREYWNDHAEHSVFPLEALEGSARHAFSYLGRDQKIVDEILRKMEEELQKIDVEKLEKVMIYSDDDRLSELKSRAIETLGHLFDTTFNFDPRTEEEQRNIQNLRNLVENGQTKVLPVLNSLVQKTDFIKHISDNCTNGKFAFEISHYVRLAQNISDSVNEENQKEIYKLFSEAGEFASPERILKASPKVINLACTFGTEEEIKLIEDQIFDALLYDLPGKESTLGSKTKLKFIKGIAGIQKTAIIKTVGQAFTRVKQFFVEKYKIVLGEVTKKEVIKLVNWPDTLCTIASIEEQYPGGSQKLCDEYGIHCFFRYDANDLILQLREEEEQIPYGIIVSAYADHNDAFARDHLKLNILQKELRSKGMKCKIIEVGSQIDFARKMIELDEKNGTSNKISFLILNAHGEENSFLLSRKQDGSARTVTSETLDGKGVQRMKDFFVNKPEIVLLSCSTGAEMGIGQKISEKFDAHVVAPIKPTAIKDFSVEFDNADRPQFNVVFSDSETHREYVGGKFE